MNRPAPATCMLCDDNGLVDGSLCSVCGRPPVKLVGQDGNAYAIIGACRRAARRAGWSAETVAAIVAEMTSGDYSNVLATAMRYFEVE